MSHDTQPLAPVEINGFVNRRSTVRPRPPAPESQHSSDPEPSRLADEAWRPVVGFAGYEVSDHGRVRRSSSGRILRGRRSCKYLSVCLSIHGQVQQKLIHRLVAEAFLGPVPDDHQVDHLDGEKDNNRADNLEYVTGAANTARAWDRLGDYRARDNAGRFLPGLNVDIQRAVSK